MRKSNIERSYHNGHRGHPMINVKQHLWVSDLIRKWRDAGHEFSGDTAFWDWVEETYDADATEYGSEFDLADEWAREGCWERAKDIAHEIWPQYSTEMVDEKAYFPEYPPGCRWRFTGNKVPRKRYHVQAYSAGRSGGWLVVDGLPDIDDWDAIALNDWRRFHKCVRAIADEEYPYDFIWQLHENVYEPNVVEPARRAADRGAEADADMWVTITRSLETT